VILILVTAFSNFFSPFLYERLNKGTDAAKREIIKVSYIFIIVIFIALLLLTLVTPLIFSYFIDKDYSSGVKYVFWVGLGYFFWAFYAIFSGYIFYLKKTKVLGFVAIVNVVLNILFNFLFIKQFGAIGAAYATCLSYFIVAIIMGVLVNRLYPMPWLYFLKSNSKI
jgi:O-antigen/teichoic acid export membrane protein